MVLTSLSLDQVLVLVVSVIAPLVVGLLTKASWNKNLKALLLMAIAIAIGIVQGFLAAPHGTTWSWSLALVNGLIAWVIAVATHYGLWKPVGATEVAQKSLVK